MFLLKYTLLFTFSVVFAVEDKSLLKSYPTEPLLNEIIAFQTLPGHHFNIKSKTHCGNGHLLKETESLVECQMDAPGTSQLEVYICDDAKTFCKRESFKLTTQSPDGVLGWLNYYKNTIFNQRYWNTPFKSGVSYNSVARGFTANELQTHLEKAKREKKLLFVYFTQLSCPPCRLLKEMTFASDEFQDILKDYIPVQIDIDLDIEADKIKPLEVRGTPTMIVFDSDFKEIGRTTRLMSPTVIKTFLSQLPKKAPQQVDKNEDSTWSNDFKKFKTNAEKIDFLKSLDIKTFTDIRQLDWSNYLFYIFETMMGLKLPQDQALATKVFSLLTPLEAQLQSVTGDDLQKAYNLNVYYEITAYLYEHTKNEKEAKLTKEKHLRLLEHFLQLPGVNQTHQLAILKADLSEDPIKKKQVLDDMRAANQNDYTYDFWEASEAMQKKDFNTALQLVDKSLAIAKDRSWQKAFLMKIEILQALQRRAEAAKLIDDLMLKMELPQNTSMKVHSFVQELRRLQFKLKGPM